MPYKSPSAEYIIATSKKRWTREEFRQIPESNQRIEWEDGQLIIMASPSVRHQRISIKLIGALLPYVAANDLGELLYEIDVDISDVRTVVPDIIFISDDNARLIGTQAIRGAPDLIIEILSESTQKRDWDTKLKAYQTAGVKHYWIVSQDLTIWEFVANSAEFKSPEFFDKGEDFKPTLFPDFSFNLAALMGELPSEDSKQDE